MNYNFNDMMTLEFYLFQILIKILYLPPFLQKRLLNRSPTYNETLYLYIIRVDEFVYKSKMYQFL